MDAENTILDFEQTVNDPEQFLASSGVRLANYILDRIFFSLLITGVGGATESLENISDNGAGIALMLIVLFIPGYWVVSEYFFGKTPAKFLTKTKVVTEVGKRPEFWQIVGRTLCRVIPFEPLSFLGSRPVGWHDSLSKTRVVTDNFGDWEDGLI